MGWIGVFAGPLLAPGPHVWHTCSKWFVNHAINPNMVVFTPCNCSRIKEHAQVEINFLPSSIWWLLSVNKQFESDWVLLDVKQSPTLFPPFTALVGHCSLLPLTHTLAATSTIPSDNVAHISPLPAAPERSHRRPKSKTNLSVYRPRVTAQSTEQWRALWRNTMLL